MSLNFENGVDNGNTTGLNNTIEGLSPSLNLDASDILDDGVKNGYFPNLFILYFKKISFTSWKCSLKLWIFFAQILKITISLLNVLNFWGHNPIYNIVVLQCHANTYSLWWINLTLDFRWTPSPHNYLQWTINNI